MNPQKNTCWKGIAVHRDQGITLADLEGRDFATVNEVAAIMRADPRTIRRRIDDGTIPATRAGDWRIPVSWLKRQAEGIAA